MERSISLTPSASNSPARSVARQYPREILGGELQRLAEVLFEPGDMDVVEALAEVVQRRQHQLLKVGQAHLSTASKALHPEDAEPRRLDRRVQGRRKRQTQHPAGLRGRDDAVVPEPRRREIG